jgi:alpha-tubulin suppressor-like RCC1 family protein
MSSCGGVRALQRAQPWPTIARTFVIVAIVLLCGRSSAHTLMTFGTTDSSATGCASMIPLPGCASSSTTCHCVPTAVLENVTMACSGRSHALAVLANGTAVATGLRSLLGVGEADAWSSTCNADAWQRVPNWPPLDASGAATVAVVDIKCATNYTLLHASNGTVYFLGLNWNSAFGVSSAEQQIVSTPTAMQFSISSPVASMASGYEAAVFALRNGSVLVSGSGTLRSAAGSGSSPTALLPIPASICANVVNVSVSVQTAVALCADGITLIGWGDNSAGQLSDSASTTLAITDVTANLNGSDAIITEVSTSPTHTLVLLSNGTVMGRGSNTAGQLALGSGVTGAALFTTVPTPGSLRVEHVSAGRGYSLLLSETATSLAGGSYSNLFGAGSNSACALGLATDSIGQVNEFTSVRIARLTDMRAVSVLADESRRSLVLVMQTRTLTASGSHTALSSSPSNSASVTQTPTSSLTPTRTASGTPSRPPTRSRTATASPTRRTYTGSTSATRAETQSAALTLSSTKSKDIAAAPQLLNAVFSSTRNFVMATFDVDTNRFGAMDADYSVTSETMKLIFALTGTAQKGEAGSGRWISAKELFFLVSTLERNVTIGVAGIVLLPTAKITRANEASSQTPAGSTVLLQSSLADDVTARDDEIKTNAPKWLMPLLITLGLLFLGGIFIAFVVFIVLRRRQRALDAEKKRLEQDMDRRGTRPLRAKFEDSVQIDGVVEPAEAPTAKAPAPDAIRMLRTMYGEDFTQQSRVRTIQPLQPSPPRAMRSGAFVMLPRTDSEVTSAAARSLSRSASVASTSGVLREHQMMPSWTSRREFPDDPSLPNFGADGPSMWRNASTWQASRSANRGVVPVSNSPHITYTPRVLPVSAVMNSPWMRGDAWEAQAQEGAMRVTVEQTPLASNRSRVFRFDAARTPGAAREPF